MIKYIDKDTNLQSNRISNCQNKTKQALYPLIYLFYFIFTIGYSITFIKKKCDKSRIIVF